MLRVILKGVAITAALSACVSETAVTQIEDAAAVKHLAVAELYQGKSASLDALSNYAFDLSRDYEEQAADAALGRDIVVSLIFASAGASVLGSIQGLADEAIAKRALAGVAASEIGKYASPATASAAIYKAAKQMNCIGVQTTSFSALDSDPGASLQARAAAFGAIRESQIRLKEGLKRTAPDFSTLRNALATGAGVTLARSLDGATVAGLRTALATCLTEDKKT